jgi:copper transport protein
MRWLAAAIVLVVVATLVPAGGASAHAYLARSEPAAGAVLPAPPSRVLMEFTEPPDLQFTSARVLDIRGNVVHVAELRPEGAATVSFALHPLPQGTYTVAWRNVSAVDGHSQRGTFAFTIGSAPEIPFVPIEFLSPGGPARWVQALSRLLTLAAFTLTAGTLALAPFGLRRAAEGSQDPWLARRLGAALRGEAFVAAALLVLSLFAALWVQVWLSGGTAGSLFSSDTRSLVTGTRFGTTWLVRLGLTALACTALLALMWPNRRGARVGRNPVYTFAGLAAAFALPAAVSANSHTAAETSRDAVGAFVDWAHFVAAIFWVGGLAQLVLASIVARWSGKSAAEGARAALRSFSPVAVLAVATLAASGVAGWWILVGGLGDTFDTGYGQLIVVKTVLFIGMLALGAQHYLLGRSGRRRAAASARRQLSAAGIRWTLLAEAGLGAAVLVVAAFLVNTAPPSGAHAGQLGHAGHEEHLIRRAVAGDLDLTLHVAPAQPGANALALDVRRRDGSIPAAAEVLLRLTYLEADLGTSEERAGPQAPGRFGLGGVQLSLPGRWQVDAVVRQPGQEDAVGRFQVFLAEGVHEGH